MNSTLNRRCRNHLRTDSIKATAAALFLIFTLAFCSRTAEDGPITTETRGVEGKDRPVRIHLTWQHDPATTMTVAWETSSATEGSCVRYGTGPGYTSSVNGTSGSEGTAGRMHIVELTGLIPGTLYPYRCGDDTGGWSFDHTFTTAPVVPGDFVFCAAGDSRNNRAEWDKIVGLMQARRPAFTLFPGDMVDRSNDLRGYDLWLQTWERMGKDSVIAPVVGNHEGSGSLYYRRFALPAPKKWYSFTYGMAHFVALSTQDPFQSGSPQYRWLQNDLQTAAANPSIRWRIVFFHNPPYAIGGHAPDLSVRKELVPLFDQFAVDTVFNGHDHYYARTFPLRGGKIADSGPRKYRHPHGTIYVITGGCGAPLYRVGSSPLMAQAQSVFHFIVVRVSAEGWLQAEAYRDDGRTVIDTFRIEKN